MLPSDQKSGCRRIGVTAELERLEREVVRCRRCPRLAAWRAEVALKKVRRFRAHQYWGRPVPAFGSPEAALVIVGLAPAAHGGNRTGRMFTGDRSGDWLFEALYRYGFANQPASVDRADGLQLRNCWITAAARCAPPQNRPAPDELRNCRDYLCRELRLLRHKRVVIALGRIAFSAFLEAWKDSGGRLPPGGPARFGHGAQWQLPGGTTLLASYHPSQQNTLTGRLTREMFHSVFRRAQQILG